MATDLHQFQIVLSEEKSVHDIGIKVFILGFVFSCLDQSWDHLPGFLYAEIRENMCTFTVLRKRLHTYVYGLKGILLCTCIIYILKKWKHSEECMCHLLNKPMRDYQESVTTGQTHTHRRTDRRQTK